MTANDFQREIIGDDKPYDWVICGRLIGKATGWDQVDTWVMQLYGFTPAPLYKGPVGECVSFNFERGLIETYDSEGVTIKSCDLIDAIKNCPVDRIE